MTGRSLSLPGGGAPRRLLRLVGPVLVLAIAALIARQVIVDWRRLPAGGLAALRPNPWPLVAAGAVQTLGWLLAVDAWRRILAGLGVRASFLEHAQIYAYTALAQVVPGSLWVPAGRVLGYRQAGASSWAVGAGLIIEWLLIGIAGALWFTSSAPLGVGAVAPSWLPWLAVGLLVATLASPGGFSRCGQALLAWRGRDVVLPLLRRRDLAFWLLEEVAVVGAAGLSLHLFMHGLTAQSDLALAVSTIGITVAVGAWLAWMPLTAVLRAGMMVVLLTPLYHSSVIALAVAIIWRMWCLGLTVSWAVLAALGARGMRLPRPETGPREEGS